VAGSSPDEAIAASVLILGKLSGAVWNNNGVLNERMKLFTHHFSLFTGSAFIGFASGGRRSKEAGSNGSNRLRLEECVCF